MLGEKVGQLRGIDVRRISEVNLVGSEDDDIFYWVRDKLYYKTLCVGEINERGTVTSFDAPLFQKLQNMPPRGKIKEIFDCTRETKKESYETDFSDEETKSKSSVADLLEGFNLAADKFMEEFKK